MGGTERESLQDTREEKAAHEVLFYSEDRETFLKLSFHFVSEFQFKCGRNFRFGNERPRPRELREREKGSSHILAFIKSAGCRHKAKVPTHSMIRLDSADI